MYSGWIYICSLEEIRGVGIKTLLINENAHLIVTLTNNEIQDAGRVYGEKGDNATVTVNKTTTVEYTEPANVKNISSDPTNAVFDFYIPQGAKSISGFIDQIKVEENKLKFISIN